ncbi:MAG: M23 family metallopeptidase [Eubacteriales bacterium]|nr:M23 family metallopeptidase [Eubacteriales bacterium]
MKDENVPRIELGEMQARYSRRGSVTHRRRSARREGAPYAAGQADEQGTDKLPLQLFICGAICLVIIGMKNIDLPIANDALQGLKIAVSAQSDMDKALGKLRFVTNLFPETTEVFNPTSDKIMLPVSGSIQSVETEAPYAISMVADTEAPVSAVGAGRVFYAGNSATYGTLVRVVHNGGFETVYTGLTPTVKAGDDVAAGQSLGILPAGTQLRFLVYQDGAAIPAQDYLETAQ